MRAYCKTRVGQNSIYAQYVTVYLVIFLAYKPYIHRTFIVLIYIYIVLIYIYRINTVFL